jgi:hypothetical protein
MGTAERKEKIAKLKEEHENYFKEMGIENPLYIPKMAYRPSGKDELYISFFPSELEKEKDIYTEFVSINYDSEDPKRTLYLYRDNPYFKDEYELAVSNSGFERYFVPVSELIIINDVTNRNKNVKEKKEILKLEDLSNPDEDLKGAILKLAYQFQNLIDILTTKINKL